MQQNYQTELSKDAPVFTPTITAGFDSNAQVLPNQFNNMYVNYSQQPATTGFGNYAMTSAPTYSTPTTNTNPNLQNHFDVYAQQDAGQKATPTVSNANVKGGDEGDQFVVSANNYGRHPNVSMPANANKQQQPQQQPQLLPTKEPSATDFRNVPSNFENPYGADNSYVQQQQQQANQQFNPYQQQQFTTAPNVVNPYENFNSTVGNNNTYGNNNNYFAQQHRQGGGYANKRDPGNYRNNNRYGGNNRWNNNQRYGNNNYHQRSGGGYGGRGRGGYDNRQPMYWKETGPRHSEYEGMVKASKNRDEQLEKRVFGTPSVLQGINFDDYDKIKVEVGNYEGFAPMESFETANLAPLLLENIKKCGFKKPTPIQKYTIPPAVAQRDIMACAQTGSGKTAAFLLPVVQTLLMNPNTEQQKKNPYGRKAFPKALIISPTRELAQQIHKDCLKFVYRAGLGCACVFGGSSIEKQSQYFNHTIHILTATVGRLWDFHTRGNISFEQVDFLILDEADRMLDMGFEKDIMNIIYNSDIKQKRTNLLFSATLPKEIQQLAASFLDNYIFLACGRVGAVGHLISQQFEFVQTDNKTTRLIELLQSIEGRSLVFTATKRKADELEHQLNSLRQRIRCVAIHGDKSQRAREKALKSFRDNRISVMIATDVASRGLDIPDVSYVIQYDTPDNIDSYVHRIGRTGRCGNKGTAISFLNDKNKPILKSLVNLLYEEKVEIPPWLLQLQKRHGNFRPNNRRGRGRGRYNKHRNYRGRGRGHGRHNNYNNNYQQHQNNNYGGNQGGFNNNPNNNNYQQHQNNNNFRQ